MITTNEIVVIIVMIILVGVLTTVIQLIRQPIRFYIRLIFSLIFVVFVWFEMYQAERLFIPIVVTLLMVGMNGYRYFLMKDQMKDEVKSV